MIKNIFKFSISNIVNLFLGFISVILLTRIFDPDVCGVLDIFNTTVATCLSIVYFGLDASFIRFYNEPPNLCTKKQFGTKLMLLCVFFNILIGTIVVIFLSDKITIRLFGFASKLICSLMFVSISSQIILRFLNIKSRMDFNAKKYNIQNILLQVSLKFIVIIAAVMNVSVESILLFNVLGVFLLAIILLITQRKDFFSFKSFFSINGYSKVFKFAIFSAPLAICINLNNSISKLFITDKLGLSSVGIYSSAGFFVTLISALQGGFTTFWSAYMYSNYHKKQEEIKKVNEYLLFMIIVGFSLMIIFRDILYIFVGEKYQSSKEFFSLVLCYPILMLASETTAYGITIKNKNYLNLISFIISTIVNLILIFLLIPNFGLKGVAFSSMVSSIILYLLRSLFGQKNYISISNKVLTFFDVLAIVLLSLIPAIMNNYATNVLVSIILLVTCIINYKIILKILKKCFKKDV